eukprot:5147199-Amphidinium_carterae.3
MKFPRINVNHRTMYAHRIIDPIKSRHFNRTRSTSIMSTMATSISIDMTSTATASASAKWRKLIFSITSHRHDRPRCFKNPNYKKDVNC